MPIFMGSHRGHFIQEMCQQLIYISPSTGGSNHPGSKLSPMRQVCIVFLFLLLHPTDADFATCESYQNNVNIGDYSVEPVVDELAHCMYIFPSLHTIRLQVSPDPAQRRYGYRNKVTKVFSNRLYPQIHSIFVSRVKMCL